MSRVFRLRDSYPFLSGFPTVLDYTRFQLCKSTTPTVRRLSVWALPRSLAATWRIDFSFSSSGYLDVSVHRVPSSQTIYSSVGDGALPPPGFPIRTSMDITLVCSSPWLFAAYHVLLRLLIPRHPPYALFSLIFEIVIRFTFASYPYLFSVFLLYCFLPLTSMRFSMCSWWAQVDSNHRPHAYQACALTC